MATGSPDPLGAAVRALAQRELSTHELTERLERKGIAEPDRLAVVERLTRAGYVNDERFAVARARVLAERGLGDSAIRADLEQRGLDAEAVEIALAALDAEAERARREAARLGGGGRAARALARKGFADESIESAVRLERE